MKNIVLKKSQVTDLYSADECSDWKNAIMDILTSNILKKDSDDIEIPEKYITLLKSKGSTKQKELVTYLGIDLIQRKVKNLKSAYDVLGLNYGQYIKYIFIEEETGLQYGLSHQQIKETMERRELQVLADALNKENDNWVPDYTDGSQRKYRPYFVYDGSSGRWSCDGYVSWAATSHFGSRLVFENADDAQYFGNLILKLGYSI